MKTGWKSPIGVDLSGRWLKAAQVVAPRANSFTLAGACRLERAAPDSPVTPDEVAHLMEAAARAGCEGSHVRIAVPPSLAVCAALELPPRSSGAPLEQIARLELARTARLAPETLETAMWSVPPPGRGGEGTHVVAVGLPHAEAERLLAMFDTAGFEADQLDVRACALGRASGAEAAGASLLIDVGWDHTGFLLLLGGRVLYQRVLADTSLSALYRDAAARAGAAPSVVDALLLRRYDPDLEPRRVAAAVPLRGVLTSFFDTIANEVTRSLGYAAHRYGGIPVSVVRLTGDGAGLPGLSDRLAAGELPVRPLAPSDILTLPGRFSRFADAHGLVAAIGLSLPATPAEKEAA